jgi:outer membrane protein assembly factor BamA
VNLFPNAYKTPPSLSKIFLGCIATLLLVNMAMAQEAENPVALHQQKDLMDVYHQTFSTGKKERIDRDFANHFSVIGAPGYSLQTGFAVAMGFNWLVDVYKDRQTNPSILNANLTYSQYNQIMLPVQTSIWTRNNQYNFLGDYRFLEYPSSIFGLGGRTDPNKDVTIDFNSIKLHQSVLRRIAPHLYGGLGLYLDYFWNIRAIDPLSKQVNQQFQHELGNKELNFGPAFRALYDSRDNPMNSHQGSYINFVYHPSLKSWGSDSSYESILIDIRNFIPFPEGTRNTLAVWMMDWLSQSGRPPYLMLPSIGWDETYNTGRGYIQGRYRGKNMVYFESEYRFGLSKSGLLGGVVFTNLQCFSSDISNQYSNVFPGYGAGLRLKINKFSNTNICIDYGFGANNSRGFFINLGEVF